MSPTGSSSSASSSRTSKPLFARARLGDTSAFGELLARYLPRLHRWAHGRLHRAARSRVETADIVQVAAVRAIERVDRIALNDKGALIAYLRATVVNLIHDEHRSIARHNTTDAITEAVIDDRPSPLQQAIDTDLDAKYRRALERLRPQDRELIVAHVELGYTHAQLGLIANRSPNAARMALQRAMRELAEHMLGK